MAAENSSIGPWHPDISSTLPPEYLPLSTLFRPENVFTTVETARELSDFTGLPIQQLIRFRPERLVVHELLIRVSADIFVSDGTRYEDLGVNYRNTVDAILCDYLKPQMAAIVERFNGLCAEIESRVEAELAANLFKSETVTAKVDKGFSLSRLFKSKSAKSKRHPAESPQQRDQRVLSAWEEKANCSEDSLEASIYRALGKVTKAIVIKHGRITHDKDLLKALATALVSNEQGSEVIGEMISPCIRQAIAERDYRLLPPQSKPVVINVKGSSASGKSTMRPIQRIHAEKLGLNWHDFALISPDIWRKYLLDYDALGDAYKYAGTLAGDELPIVDRKLDRYIGLKAFEGRISHLLIDRFRFDSFAPGKDSEEGSNLLTRFGHTVYLTFMVTPPHATVERAWVRGLQVGRYKAVDDLLDHNIEAFRGIPNLFFTWALRKDKTVYYEFLDNSVEKGQKPRTIAFGLNGQLYIFDIGGMLDITRYTKINIDAEGPEQVYLDGEHQEPTQNTEFFQNCARQIPEINFVDRGSGMIYARMESSNMAWIDPGLLKQKLEAEEASAGFLAVAPRLMDELETIPHQQAAPVSADALRHTMGELN